MKDESNGKLKIDPRVTPLRKKELFSNLNYIEAAVLVLGVSILIFVLINVKRREAGILDNEGLRIQEENETQKNELIDLREKAGVNLLSEQEKQEQLSELDGFRNQTEVKPFSSDEKQQQLDELNKLHNLNY
ncbi:MAG: hypothetical protein NUV64_00700 [Parcubacteria group bacterium]|nr:hypothetical protein [Parcubacteria group bacterium]MCR4342629.1 hypothetical protein [Patescibacteria group bacterium]